MTALWTAVDAALATQGHAQGNWQATGVSIDTRTLQPGDLFIALKAARDGHEFVAQALAKGAAAAMVTHIPEGVPEDAPLLVVDDVLAALTALGAQGRARTAARVIGITGSVGKTTTKEMLRAVLSPQGRTHAAEASYNNHWGVPLTLARMPVDTEFAIIEIGMNAPGEIAPLSRLARPHVAMVTIVAAAHLEAFGAIEGIAREKASIFEGLEPGGVALINADVGTTDILAAAAGPILRRVGMAEDADIRLLEVTLSEQATVIQAHMDGAARLFKLAVPGRHFAMNALFTLGAVAAVGADVTSAALALATWRPYAGRGTREELELSAPGDLPIALIDDAFNANPTSLAAALEVLSVSQPQARGRRIAVLGDMLELGDDEQAMHAGIADLAVLADIDVIHTAGPLMAHLHGALGVGKRGLHCVDAAEMARSLPRELQAGDVVLIKGSKGSKISTVVDALRNLGQGAADRVRGPR